MSEEDRLTQGVSEEGYIRRVLERDLAAPHYEAMDADRDMLQRSERAAERIRELRKGNILPEGVTMGRRGESASTYNEKGRDDFS